MRKYFFLFVMSLFFFIGCTSTKSVEKQSNVEFVENSTSEMTKIIDYKPSNLLANVPIVLRDSVFSGSVVTAKGDTVVFSMPFLNVERQSSVTQNFATVRVHQAKVKAVETTKTVNSITCRESKSDVSLSKSSFLMFIKEIIVWGCLFLGLGLGAWIVIKKRN